MQLKISLVWHTELMVACKDVMGGHEQCQPAESFSPELTGHSSDNCWICAEYIWQQW